MRYMVCSLILIASAHAQGASCKAQLMSLLYNAKAKVNAVLEEGSPCHNAAMVGRKFGPPGCYPPDLNKLLGVLTPLLGSAKTICNTTCKGEGKEKLCLAATDKDKLKQQGIDGIISLVSYNIINKTPYAPAENVAPAPVDF